MPRIYNNIVNNLYQREISHNNLHSSKQIVASCFGLSSSFYKTDLKIHRGCVNAIKFSNDGQWMVSGGDDMTVMFSNVEKSLRKGYKPMKGKLRHRGNIFCLALNHDSTRVFSGGTDEQLIIHDTSNGDLITSRFFDCSAIYDIAVNPHDHNTIAIGSEDGRIHIFDCRTNLPEPANNQSFLPDNSFKSIQYNPLQPHLLLVASGCEQDVGLVDLRNREIVFQYLSPFSKLKGATSARYNSLGDQILVMRNRVSSSLYNSKSSNCICEFDSFGFYSSITQKTVCFAGPDDEYAVVPSDDFNVYLFKIPSDLRNQSSKVDNERPIRFVNSADFVLKGHRSIVNQVQYNYQRAILATSGVETVIKYFSPFPLNLDDEVKREDLSTSTSDRQINPYPIPRASIFEDYSDDDNNQTDAANEDTVILNFFDNLIRHNLCDDDIDEFIDLNETTSIEKQSLVDPQFEHDLRFVKSLILDFKQNGEQFKMNSIRQLKKEQLIDKKLGGMVSTRSVSYLFNNKKIKQSKIIIKQAYQMIQNRLRFIRKCKKEENQKDDDWLSKVQELIDYEPELKQMLLDLNEIYKDKRVIELFSSPLYYELLKRLAKLFFRRPLVRNLPILSADNDDESVSSYHSSNAEQPANDANNNNETTVNGVDDKEENDQRKQDNDTDKSISTDFDSDDSSKYGLTLSDDSLSAGSVLNSNEDTDEENRKINKRNLKRKKLNDAHKSKYLKKTKSSSNEFSRVSNHLFSFSLSSSSSDDDDSLIGEKEGSRIRRFKKSRSCKDKSRKYNQYAFDSDLDVSSTSSDSTSSASSSEDEKADESQTKASTSTATTNHKRSIHEKFEEAIFTLYNERKRKKKEDAKSLKEASTDTGNDSDGDVKKETNGTSNGLEEEKEEEKDKSDPKLK